MKVSPASNQKIKDVKLEVINYFSDGNQDAKNQNYLHDYKTKFELGSLNKGDNLRIPLFITSPSTHLIVYFPTKLTYGNSLFNQVEREIPSTLKSD